MVNLSRVIGPSIGGVIIAAVGEAWCFFLDGRLVRRSDRVAGRDDASRCARASRRRRAISEELVDGFRYVSRFPPVRSALLLLALVSTMGMPYTVLMPAVSRRKSCTATRTRSAF